MGSITALNSALSGLSAAQASLDVISNNISNVNTPGFTRKTLPQGTSVLQGQGVGVSVDVITRSVNTALQRDLFEQTSISASFQTKQDFFDQIQTFHGDPALELDIGSQLSRLQNAFVSLENTPEDIFEIENTLAAAQSFAEGVSGFSEFVTQLRNDTQSLIDQAVNEVNTLLGQIAELNISISAAESQGLSTAALEDSRDLAISSLSEQLEISTFTSGDGVLNVLSNGLELVDTRSQDLFFDPLPLSATSFFPDSASSLLLGSNDPSTALDLTQSDLGGNLGALFELRDQILPQITSQIDELAIRTAERFQAQGLELFTDQNGLIPDGTPVDLNALLPGDPIPAPAYVGFADSFQVNPAVEADPSLLRTGTVPGLDVGDGSNELIRRINEFTFGGISENQVNATLPAATVIGVDFGFATRFNASGTADLIGPDPLTPIALDSLAGITNGANDTIDISIDNGVNFTSFTIGAGDTAQDFVNTINATFAGLATLNTNGQIEFANNTGIIVNDNNIGATGLASLGIDGFVGTGPIPPVNLNPALPAAQSTVFSAITNTDITGAGAFPALDLSANINPGVNDTFQISVDGGTSFTPITIGAGETAEDLVASINTSFPGLAALNTDGRILFRNTTGLTIQDVNLGAAGQADLGIDDIITGGAVSGFQLNTDPGITPLYNAQGSVNVTEIGALDSLIAIETDNTVPGGPNDTFQVSVNGGGFVQFEIGAGETAAELVTRINGIFPGFASINGLGQFEFESNLPFEIQDVNLNPAGLQALGLDSFTDTGPIAAQNPSFDLRFGNETPVTIEILPTDTVNDIVNRINAAVPDVTASFDTTTNAFLIDPNNGGDIAIIDGFGTPLQDLGLSLSSVSHTTFQTANLGPNAGLSSGILGANFSLLDFAQAMINSHAQESNLNQLQLDTEESFRATLEGTFLDESGVNIDVEVANLISVQTAFSASARVVSTIEEFFDTLIAIF